MKIKTIDVNAKEWFDRINGNSYFSGTVTVNFGMKDQKSFTMRFQYGYGDQYIHEAKARLVEHNIIDASSNTALWRYCDENNIILRTNIQRNCLKREVVNV